MEKCICLVSLIPFHRSRIAVGFPVMDYHCHTVIKCPGKVLVRFDMNRSPFMVAASRVLYRYVVRMALRD